MKMLAGELYDAADPVLANERLQARLLLRRYNDLPAGEAGVETTTFKRTDTIAGTRFMDRTAILLRLRNEYKPW